MLRSQCLCWEDSRGVGRVVLGSVKRLLGPTFCQIEALYVGQPPEQQKERGVAVERYVDNYNLRLFCKSSDWLVPVTYESRGSLT